MTPYEILKVLHVIGACALLGTGSGIAFFMLMAHRSGDPAIIAHTARIVVIADFLFTASAVLLQPLTGLGMALVTGQPLGQGWLLWSIALYLLVGCFWLPVVWIQLRLRDLALAAARAGTGLPQAYHRLYGLWRACGVPAFAAVIGIIALMVAKPG